MHGSDRGILDLGMDNAAIADVREDETVEVRCRVAHNEGAGTAAREIAQCLQRVKTR
jgi:hypothetical protein